MPKTGSTREVSPCSGLLLKILPLLFFIRSAHIMFRKIVNQEIKIRNQRNQEAKTWEEEEDGRAKHVQPRLGMRNDNQRSGVMVGPTPPRPERRWISDLAEPSPCPSCSPFPWSSSSIPITENTPPLHYHSETYPQQHQIKNMGMRNHRARQCRIENMGRHCLVGMG